MQQIKDLALCDCHPSHFPRIGEDDVQGEVDLYGLGRDIEQAAADGLDVAFDAFPYTVGNSTINVVFPDWFLAGFEENIYSDQALRRLK